MKDVHERQLLNLKRNYIRIGTIHGIKGTGM